MACLAIVEMFPAKDLITFNFLWRAGLFFRNAVLSLVTFYWNSSGKDGTQFSGSQNRVFSHNENPVSDIFNNLPT